MKQALVFVLILFAFSGCQKPFDRDHTCTNVKVTLSAPSCKRVGVIISGTIYPADDLPDQYAVDGKDICIQYSFYNDETKCGCCGGKKVHIIAVH